MAPKTRIERERCRYKDAGALLAQVPLAGQPPLRAAAWRRHGGRGGRGRRKDGTQTQETNCSHYEFLIDTMTNFILLCHLGIGHSASFFSLTHLLQRALSALRARLCSPSSLLWRDQGAKVAMGMPTFCFWEEILQEHPNAKVILTVRDEEEWWESVQRAKAHMDHDLPGAPLKAGSGSMQAARR